RGSAYQLTLEVAPNPALWQLSTHELWPALLVDLAADTPIGLIAARFHVALAAGLAQLCARVFERERSCRPVARQVALSGGCLQNAVLHECLERELQNHALEALTHAAIPTNDGGIALGQALVTLARVAEETVR
ncbi:MAG: carbamoyltransferase HypF, partial [Polyangiales bacterium]